MFCMPASLALIRMRLSSPTVRLVQVRCIKASMPKYVWGVCVWWVGGVCGGGVVGRECVLERGRGVRGTLNQRICIRQIRRILAYDPYLRVLAYRHSQVLRAAPRTPRDIYE
jgi:hypothetical protein